MATITEPEVEIEVAIDPNDLPSDVLYEVIEGRIVEMPPMGAYPTEIATILSSYLVPHVRQANLGRVLVEPIFRIDGKTQYRPDVAFVSFAKWPKTRRTPNTDPWDVIPELAIEVVSKNDKAVNVLTKVAHYFRAGVRAVWLVYPTLEVIHIFDSFETIQVLTRTDELDGGDLIPGFKLSLASLFEETEDEPEALASDD